MKPQYSQSLTSAIRFDAVKTTADTGNLASLMAGGMVYLGSVFHDAGFTLVAAPAQDGLTSRPLQGTSVQFTEPYEPVATDDWDAIE